jgi:3'(2'), 5'-bisphosphate nucleotidase
VSSFFSEAQIEKIVSIALEAGEIAALAFKAKNFSIEKKSDNSQVTSADIAVSKFLHEKLSQEFAQIPIICEEGNLREISDEVFFLVDPIDGTSSFVLGSSEFSLNIALVKEKKAIFGLIYAPLFEGGRMIFSNHKDEIITRDFNGEQKILNHVELDISKLRIITSARTKDSDIVNYIEQIHPDFSQNFVVEKLSSAIKFFRLLDQKSNLYLHFRPSMEWDTASGQALVELRNGKVKKLFFNQNQIEIAENLDYKKPNFSNTAFVAII